MRTRKSPPVRVRLRYVATDRIYDALNQFPESAADGDVLSRVGFLKMLVDVGYAHAFGHGGSVQQMRPSELMERVLAAHTAVEGSLQNSALAPPVTPAALAHAPTPPAASPLAHGQAQPAHGEPPGTSVSRSTSQPRPAAAIETNPQAPSGHMPSSVSESTLTDVGVPDF